METTKIYHQAPLPFVGQKRNFIRHFREVLQQNIENDGQGWTIIDVFGGSGLLAHNAKRLKPQATVIYNDFDGYAQRLQYINDTNRLRQQIIDCMKHLPVKKRIPTALKEQILDIICQFDGFVDIRCLNSWLLFSGKQVSSFDELAKCELYNRVRLSDYKVADGYLNGLNIINEDFRTLLPKYSAQEKTLFLLDPPYLCTQQQAYALADYFGMTNFLELMTMVRPPYIFFSSTRSELLDYMKYIEKYDAQTWERVGGFETISIQATLNPYSTYEDNMLYRFE